MWGGGGEGVLLCNTLAVASRVETAVVYLTISNCNMFHRNLDMPEMICPVEKWHNIQTGIHELGLEKDKYKMIPSLISTFMQANGMLMGPLVHQDETYDLFT